MEKEKIIRVLLVDDEERFRTTATVTLKKRGFEVTAVPGGVEALAEVRKGNVDVVVLDLKMPGMDGNETLRELKIIKPDLPVIMLTAHGTITSALESWRDEVHAYLTKPYDMDLLSEKIREAFAHKRGIDGAMWYSVWKEEQPPG